MIPVDAAHLLAGSIVECDDVESAEVIDGPGHPTIAVAMDDGDEFFLTVERA